MNVPFPPFLPPFLSLFSMKSLLCHQFACEHCMMPNSDAGVGFPQKGGNNTSWSAKMGPPAFDKPFMLINEVPGYGTESVILCIALKKRKKKTLKSIMHWKVKIRSWCYAIKRCTYIPIVTVPLSSLTSDQENGVKNNSEGPAVLKPNVHKVLTTKAPPATTAASSLLKFPSRGDSHRGQTTKAPINVPEKQYNSAGNLLFCALLFKKKYIKIII